MIINSLLDTTMLFEREDGVALYLHSDKVSHYFGQWIRLACIKGSL